MRESKIKTHPKYDIENHKQRLDGNYDCDAFELIPHRESVALSDAEKCRKTGPGGMKIGNVGRMRISRLPKPPLIQRIYFVIDIKDTKRVRFWVRN